MKRDNRGSMFAVLVLCAIIAISNFGCGKRTTKDQWKAKLGERQSLLRVTGMIVMPTRDFIKIYGKPSKTQTIQGRTFWYYDCSDGVIQLDLDASALTVGIMQGNANDY